MGFTLRAHFPLALQAVLISKLIIKLGCNIKQALFVGVAYDDSEIQSSLHSNLPILELSQHAKLYVRVQHHFMLLLARFSKNALTPQIPLRHGTLLATLS